MKQKLFILGLATAGLLTLGTIFKINHWPAAGIMIIAGILSFVLLFLPAALINNFRVNGTPQNRILYIVTYLTSFVVFIGMLFKIMHWPGAGWGLIIALPFPYVVFLPVYLIVTEKNKSHNIYNTVYILLLLALNSTFAALLALHG
jgi:hypothetical protein